MESLYAMPADSVNLAAIEAFLTATPFETTTAEFKSAWTSGLLDSIAAMANSNGGLVLLGVEESADGPRVVGTTEGAFLQVVNGCWDGLEPPFRPEIIPVPCHERRVVLLIRIDPAVIVRPVVRNGKVWIRLEGRNAPAPLPEMQRLFAEAPPVATDSQGYRSLGPWSASFARSGGQEPNMVLRSAMVVPLRPTQRPGLMVRNAARRALLRAAAESRVSGWLDQTSSEWHVVNSAPWAQRGPSNSRRATVASRRLLKNDTTILEGRVSLAADEGPGIVLMVDLLLWVEAADSHIRRRMNRPPRPDEDRMLFAGLSFSQLFEALDASIELIWSDAPNMVLPELITIPSWRPIGPISFITGPSGNLAPYLNLDLPDGVRPTHISGNEFVAAPSDRPDDADGRHEMIRRWLEQLLLDSGVVDAESVLANSRL